MQKFIAKSSELFDRFDPKYVAFKRRAANFRYPAVKMGSLLSESPEYGAGEAGIERVDEATPRYIRITDIDENGELLPGLGMTAANVEPQYFLRDGDLLFARSGNTVGKSYLHESGQVPYPCFYAGYMIRFRFSEKVLPKYVFAFAQTPYYHEWVSAIQRSAGQPNINAQEYRSLEIPLPPLPEQRRIVAELDAAYAAKRAADEKATKLLASIDDMVLRELGIVKLPKPDTSLSSRIFTVPAREVLNDRFDAHYNQNFFRDLADLIREDKRCCRLGSVGTFVRGVTYKSEDEAECGHAILRANNVSLEEFDIDLSDLVHVSSDLAFSPAQQIKDSDILICAASGSKEHAGKVAYVRNAPYDTYIGGFMMVLRTDAGVNPEYVAAYMQSSIFRGLIFRHLGGTNINNVSLELLNKLPLRMPDAAMQDGIALKASSIRAEARKLKADATAALDAAKRRIEARIVG